jgi:hypothetical protein
LNKGEDCHLSKGRQVTATKKNRRIKEYGRRRKTKKL